MGKEPERRFGTELPTAIFPEAVQVELKDILGVDILIKDYASMVGENGSYIIISFERPDGPGEFSTACGGIIVQRKVREALSRDLLPLVGAITKVPSKVKGHSAYYDLN
ncbi:hypothetical protein ES708_11581 [subsurface metagenome]